MKHKALLSLLVLTVALGLAGCRGDKGEQAQVQPPPAKVYYCPEHPANLGAKGDVCKACGKALIERPRSSRTSHASTTQPEENFD